MRVLKNRHTGETGVCGTLRWDKETSRLIEVESKEDSVFQDQTVTTGDF